MGLFTQLALYGSAHAVSYLYFKNPTKSRDLIALLQTIALSLLSIYTTYQSGLPQPALLLAVPEQTMLNDAITAHFITDLAVGHFLDRHNMEVVTGYIHHSAYAVILLVLRYTQQSNLIYLCLPFEIPTVLMNLNRMDPKKRFTLPFGTTFLFFRVLYNLYVIAAVSSNPAHATLTTLMLAVHAHWFTIWRRKFVNRNR